MDAAVDLAQKLKAVEFGALLSFLVLGWAYLRHFFKPIKPPSSHIELKHVVGAFTVFISIPVIIAPLVFGAALWIHQAGNVQWKALTLTAAQRGWLNLGVILGTIAALGLYSYRHKNLVWDLFDPDRKGSSWCLKQFGMGLLACLICLPLILTISQALDVWIDWQFNIPPIEQLAVVHLRSITEYPLLFGLTMAAVSFGVPAVEELLFRGFLQTWLAKKLGAYKAIALTAFLFALFHYASLQSWYNIQIVGTLFVLALFMGYIYFRQKSLWASIALHMLFNIIGVSAIFVEAYFSW